MYNGQAIIDNPCVMSIPQDDYVRRDQALENNMLSERLKKLAAFSDSLSYEQMSLYSEAWSVGSAFCQRIEKEDKMAALVKDVIKKAFITSLSQEQMNAFDTLYGSLSTRYLL